MVNDSITVVEGTTLALHCSTQGNPAPTLTWLKDGQLVGTITADELSVLTIVEITPQGDGQYRCLAENEHGRASSSLNITVECECVSFLYYIFKGSLKLGQRIKHDGSKRYVCVTLQCTVMCYLYGELHFVEFHKTSYFL